MESVGNNPDVANKISLSLNSEHVEKWLVNTDQFGRVTVGVVGKDGRLIPNPEAASKLLGVKK